MEKAIGKVLTDICSQSTYQTRFKIEQVAKHGAGTMAIDAIEDDLNTELVTYLPIVKIDQTRFLIGTKVKELQLKQAAIFVKVKNGCMRFEDYLKLQAKIECQELHSLISYWDGTYKTAVVNLIIRNNAHVTNISAIKRYEKMDSSEIQTDFESLMEVVSLTDTKTNFLHISPSTTPKSKVQQMSPRRKRQKQMFRFDEKAGLVYKTYTYQSPRGTSPRR